MTDPDAPNPAPLPSRREARASEAGGDAERSGLLGRVRAVSSTPGRRVRIVRAGRADAEALAVDLDADGRLVVAWTGQEEDRSPGIVQQILDPRDGVVEGTVRADLLHGQDAWGDEISGFGGADTLIGLLGDDLLLGGDDHDQLFGGRGDDALQGGRGNDTLSGGAGGDDLAGGTGTDLASYAAATAGVVVALDGSLTASGEAARRAGRMPFSATATETS